MPLDPFRSWLGEEEAGDTAEGEPQRNGHRRRHQFQIGGVDGGLGVGLKRVGVAGLGEGGGTDGTKAEAGDDEDRALSRKRWKHYLDRGYSIRRHDIATREVQ